MSNCLWSGWKWERGVKEIPSPSVPLLFVNCESSSNKTYIKKRPEERFIIISVNWRKEIHMHLVLVRLLIEGVLWYCSTSLLSIRRDYFSDVSANICWCLCSFSTDTFLKTWIFGNRAVAVGLLSYLKIRTINIFLFHILHRIKLFIALWSSSLPGKTAWWRPCLGIFRMFPWKFMNLQVEQL